MWCGALCPRLVSCVALVQAAVYNQTTQGNYMMCKGAAGSTITGCRESLSTPHSKAAVRERVQRGLLLIKRAQQSTAASGTTTACWVKELQNHRITMETLLCGQVNPGN